MRVVAAKRGRKPPPSYGPTTPEQVETGSKAGRTFDFGFVRKK